MNFSLLLKELREAISFERTIVKHFLYPFLQTQLNSAFLTITAGDIQG